MIIAFFTATGDIRTVQVEKTDNLEALVERFERDEGIISTIYDAETCLYRSAITAADFA